VATIGPQRFKAADWEALPDRLVHRYPESARQWRFSPKQRLKLLVITMPLRHPRICCVAQLVPKPGARASEYGAGNDQAQRLIYEEIARVRYLAGNGFRMLFGSEPVTAASWRKVTADADQSSEIIAADLLSRRKR